MNAKSNKRSAKQLSAKTCLTDGVIARIAAGKASKQLEKAVATHLDRCEECRTKLDEALPTDALVDTVALSDSSAIVSKVMRATMLMSDAAANGASGSASNVNRAGSGKKRNSWGRSQTLAHRTDRRGRHRSTWRIRPAASAGTRRNGSRLSGTGYSVESRSRDQDSRARIAG